LDFIAIYGAFAICYNNYYVVYLYYTGPGTTAKQSNVFALSTALSGYAAVDIQETETSAHVCAQHL